MPEQSAIAQMEKELGDMAFAWAQRRGLTNNRNDVAVTLKLRNLPKRRDGWSKVLEATHWAHIFNLRWQNPDFKELFRTLRDGGNEPIPTKSFPSFKRNDIEAVNKVFIASHLRYHLGTTRPICPDNTWEKASLQMYLKPKKKQFVAEDETV